MAQIIRLARGALHRGTVLVERVIGGAARLPEPLECGDVLLQSRKGIEQPAMGCGINQRALVMLAVNFNQRGADRFQGLHADGLVVDEGAGAAVRELHAPQDHLAGILQPVGREDSHCRMALRHVEGGRHLALLRTVADEAGIAAAAKRQRERIEQDGFARTGFTGQDREAFGKFDIEPLDQDDVADRQTRQHGVGIPWKIRTCRLV